MKTLLQIIVLALLAVHPVFSQNVSIPVKVSQTGKVVVNNLDAGIIIDGYQGEEVIISVDNYDPPPEKAKGLKPVYIGGEDNTGIGLSIEEINKIIEISGVSPRTRSAKYVFRIPMDMDVKVDVENFSGNNIELRNILKEIEVESKISDINLDNVTGPLVVNNMSGNINIKFKDVNQEFPISIRALSGDIDISLPASTKAVLKMKTLTGEVYTDFDLEMKNGDEKSKQFPIHGQAIIANINGGGVEINIETMSGYIYIRKIYTEK